MILNAERNCDKANSPIDQIPHLLSINLYRITIQHKVVIRFFKTDLEKSCIYNPKWTLIQCNSNLNINRSKKKQGHKWVPGITLTWIPFCRKKSISSPPLPKTWSTHSNPRKTQLQQQWILNTHFNFHSISHFNQSQLQTYKRVTPFKPDNISTSFSKTQ